MLIRKDRIELSHLTYENAEKFGITNAQLEYINDFLYKCSADIHNLVLEKLFYAGYYNARFKLTNTEATKLITNLLNDDEFEFVNYNSEQWHKLKLNEIKLNQTKDYIDYGLNI